MKEAVYRIVRNSTQWTWKLFSVQKKFIGGVWVGVSDFHSIGEAEKFIKHRCAGCGEFDADGNRI